MPDEAEFIYANRRFRSRSRLIRDKGLAKICNHGSSVEGPIRPTEFQKFDRVIITTNNLAKTKFINTRFHPEKEIENSNFLFHTFYNYINYYIN